MSLRSLILAPIAFAIFALVLLAALCTEGLGRLRYGKSFEPGDGLGSEEDYA